MAVWMAVLKVYLLVCRWAGKMVPLKADLLVKMKAAVKESLKAVSTAVSMDDWMAVMRGCL
jgi:hypothetical protein